MAADNKMNIVFWGSSDFSMPSLERIAAAHTVSAVVTNEDAACGRGMKELKTTPVKKFALDKNIPVLQPCDLKDEKFREELAAIGADLFVVVSYGKILPVSVLEMPRLRSVNLHASLLPKYRGASPIQTALVNGDAVTGVTVQYMSKEMDRGDVLTGRELKVLPEDNYRTLSEKLSVLGAETLLETIRTIGSGTAAAKPQAESEATYSKLIRKEDGKISFIDNTASDIYNKWRGYYVWPGVFTVYCNAEKEPESRGPENLVYLTELVLEGDPEEKKEAGKILRADKQGLVVGCKKGSIGIRKIKPSGKKEMDTVSFVNGYRPAVGRYF
jgi:methionyl-tRNA formyltransferase